MTATATERGQRVARLCEEMFMQLPVGRFGLWTIMIAVVYVSTAVVSAVFSQRVFTWERSISSVFSGTIAFLIIVLNARLKAKKGNEE